MMYIPSYTSLILIIQQTDCLWALCSEIRSWNYFSNVHTQISARWSMFSPCSIRYYHWENLAFVWFQDIRPGEVFCSDLHHNCYISPLIVRTLSCLFRKNRKSPHPVLVQESLCCVCNIRCTIACRLWVMRYNCRSVSTQPMLLCCAVRKIDPWVCRQLA